MDRLTKEQIEQAMREATADGQDWAVRVSREFLLSVCKTALASLSSRDEALEEAAKVAETHEGIAPFMADGRNVLAKAIRALRSPELNADRPRGWLGTDAVGNVDDADRGAAPDRSADGGADGMPEYPTVWGHAGHSYIKRTDYDALRQWALRRPAPPAWVSVEERLPENDDDVLIYHNLGDVERPEVPHAFDVAAYINGEWIFPWDRDMRNNPPRWVQFWMPLPASPEAGGRG